MGKKTITKNREHISVAYMLWCICNMPIHQRLTECRCQYTMYMWTFMRCTMWTLCPLALKLWWQRDNRGKELVTFKVMGETIWTTFCQPYHYSLLLLHLTPMLLLHVYNTHSQKIWWGIKFGSLVVGVETANLKSANIILPTTMT